MNKPLKITLGVLGLLVAAAGGFFVWASVTSSRILASTIETHRVEFPIPFPLDRPVEATDPWVDAADPAMERAVASGQHLVEARYACIECHGPNFGGGVMVDDPLIGRLLGPNLTLGQGSRTLDYAPADWDRIVRHGIKPDGTPSPMPAEDFQLMSDQELSDIIAYIRSMPPVDNEVPPIRLGPLGKVLMATGELVLSADLIGTHATAHLEFPPDAEVSAEFGRHLAGVCSGCHGADLSGGPIPGGDPSWAPARNLTPHEDGLEGWSYEDFSTAMLSGRRPDGSDLVAPMTLMLPYAQGMTEVELQALWAYLESVPSVPDPE